MLRLNRPFAVDIRTATVYLLLLLLLVSLLSACGWRVRGSLGVALGLPPVFVQSTDVSGELLHDLRRGLAASSVRVVEQRQEAGMVLMVKNEVRERRVLTVGADGKVNEYELQYALQYAVYDGEGELLAPLSTIDSTRDYRFDENDVLAKDEEQRQLFDYMRTNAVQNLLRRLQRLAMTQAQQNTAADALIIDDQTAPAADMQDHAN